MFFFGIFGKYPIFFPREKLLPFLRLAKNHLFHPRSTLSSFSLPPDFVIIFLLLRSSSYLRISLLSYSRDGSRRGGKEGFFCDSWMRNQGCQRFFHSGNTKAFSRISAFLFLSFAIIFLETAGAAEAVSYNSRAGFLREGV